jgi:TonB-like protein
MNTSRFKIFAMIFMLCIAAVAAVAQGPQTDAPLPVVRAAEMPLYPHLARIARIEGTVRLQVWTDGSSVVKVQRTGAHKLLMDAAEENLKTWRFYPHKATSFDVVFVYSLEKEEVSGWVNPSIVLHLPTRVEIQTKLSPAEPIEAR